MQEPISQLSAISDLLALEEKLREVKAEDKSESTTDSNEALLTVLPKTSAPEDNVDSERRSSLTPNPHPHPRPNSS